MLIEMLKESKSFQEKNPQDQEIIAVLANLFESNPNALYMTPQELTSTLRRGNKEQWNLFLNLEPTRNYIKAEMAHQAQVAQRKAFSSLATLAEEGNVQAAKEINELSGIMSQTDNNRIIVLHQVKRPEIKEVKT